MYGDQAISSHLVEELLEFYLAKMKPPELEWAENQTPAWWRKDIAIGLFVGTLMGLLIYQFGNPSEPELQAHKPAIAIAELPQPDQPKNQTLTAHLDAEQLDAEQLDVPMETEPDEEAFEAPPPDAGPEAVARAAIPSQRKASPRYAEANTRGRHHKKYKILVRKGWQLYGKTSYHAASVAFGRAVHMSPKQNAGYYGLALCMFEQGREDIAMWVLDRGLAKVGPKADLWVLAGSIHQWQGRESEARKAYNTYLQHNPKGQYARELKTILARAELPRLEPFESSSD